MQYLVQAHNLDKVQKALKAAGLKEREDWVHDTARTYHLDQAAWLPAEGGNVQVYIVVQRRPSSDALTDRGIGDVLYEANVPFFAI